MEIREYLNVVRRGWWVILGVTALFAGLAALYTFTRTPLYESHAKVFVSLQSTANIQDLIQGNSFTQQAVQGYAEVAVTPIVLDTVRAKLSLKTSTPDLAKRIEATAPVQSDVLTISVLDESPAGAMAIANAVSARLSDVAAELSTTQTGVSPVKITLIEPATVSNTPFTPKVSLYLLLGTVAGLVLGCATAAVLVRQGALRGLSAGAVGGGRRRRPRPTFGPRPTFAGAAGALRAAIARLGRRRVAVVTGIVTLVVAAGAVTLLTNHVGANDRPANVAQSSTRLPSSAAPKPEAATAPLSSPTAAANRPAAVVGSRCLPHSSNGAAADGSVLYCEMLQGSNLYMWSLYPGDIASPSSPGTDPGHPDDPSIAICMSQTGRSNSQCIAYLQRPSDPGDGAMAGISEG